MTPSKVTLREVIDADLPVLFEHQADPEAVKMAAFPSREKDAFMSHWAKIRLGEDISIRTILVDGIVAGTILAFEMVGKFEVGYWLGREFWRRGIASEALNQFLGQITRRPLYARTAKHNIASQKVLQKCGFEIIGEDSWTPSPEIGLTQEFILELK